MSQSQNHVDYATPSAPQHPYMSHHIPDASTGLPTSSAVDPGPSTQTLSFDSPQVESSIGPDRGLSRRRIRLHERVPSHGELPEYGSISQSYGHPPPAAHFAHPQGSRPHSPVSHTLFQLPDQTQPSMSSADAYNERVDGQPRPEWQMFPQNQSRSASGSAASASSNPRSASPALSVASALTSVSSASNSQLFTVSAESPIRKLAALGQRRDRKKRLYNIDRYRICMHAQQHPGMKQEDIAAHFGVERSTVSKILKQKARWLSVSPTEKVLVAKLRPSKFPLLEGRLEDWVKKASKEGKVLTDALLRRKAREFGDHMGYTEDKFKASSGWLENFKHRHGIRRGVWHGNGTLDAKYRAYATDFIPDTIEPVIPFPGTPPPIKEDRGYNDPVDTDDEDDATMHAVAEQENIPPANAQAMPSSLGLIPHPWSQSAEPTTSHASSSAAHAYGPSSPSQVAYASYDDATVGGSASGSAMDAGADSHGAQIGELAFLPDGVEVIEPIGEVDDREAERCIHKLIFYLKTRDELELEAEVWAAMFRVRAKIFGLISGRPYDQPPMQIHPNGS
ncbi:CenpB-DNA-bind-domain-containing protein [Dichomitus squalens LYAD-421 SS1]|uniref:CenpB-DNA-bind-domain-containing protein n=1 Tax=Dichomitus squalens (strain LYAD-421) TaxID=732165 RepID=R7SLU2_DICSQ|nr:CenpB-DNA-bind-domain-containing protein [Dichomitus squalens LYAD-421 SS1]EJF57114.1 CenpB-DNA-bind-domain-containing protein [Dichomitus squalens LYAD-421 SS1]